MEVDVKMKFKIAFLHLFILLFLPVSSMVAQGYKIDVKIKGAENKDAHLAFYMGDKQYITQNVKFNKSGELTFKGEQKLPPGIYFIAIDNNYFDILIRDEQEFSLKSDTTNIVGLMKIKGSKENEVFFDYQKKLLAKKKVIGQLEEKIKVLEKNNDTVQNYQNQIDQLVAELEQIANETTKKHPESYIAKLIGAMSDQNIDNFKFDDKDLLRTPFFHNRVRLFIKKSIEKNANYINYQTQQLLSSVRHEEANYQYIANYLLNFYNSFYKIGMNEVFVFIADNYFLPDKATWFNQKQLEEIQKRRDFFAQSLPGKAAQDLTLESTTGEFFSLHQVKANTTLLYFWSADCGHCTKSTKILKSYYEQLRAKNIDVFAVNIDKDKKKWLKKIEETEAEWINCYDPDETSGFREKYYVFGSPLLYVINNEKTIVAKLNGEEAIEKLCKELVSKQ
jgi:peroxiredoxin